MPELASEYGKGLYSKASRVVDEYLSLHMGEPFDLDKICRDLGINQAEKRKMIAIKLANEVKKGLLDKSILRTNTIYRYIDNNVKAIDWINAPEVSYLDIKWPYGHDEEDQSTFGFDGHVLIPRRGLIVLAGVTNSGKTGFAVNFLFENMDSFPCTVQGNEYEGSDFKDRISVIDWAKPINEKGEPKFELLEVYDNWKDYIRPDNINIIDWMNLDGTGHPFYEIGYILQGIKSKLRNGIAVVCIQKDPWKDLGRGSGFSAELASLYLAMDFGRMTVVKAKKWNAHNPNGEVYGFELVEKGMRFHRIRKVRPCPECHKSGKTKIGECVRCIGTGWIDADTAGGQRYDSRFKKELSPLD